MTNEISSSGRAIKSVDTNNALDSPTDQEVLAGIQDADLRAFVAGYLASETASLGQHGYSHSDNPKDVLEIRLAKGEIALIDKEDEPKVPKITWRVIHKEGQTYVQGHLPRGRGKRGKQIMLHRVVMDAPPGVRIDHINGNALDNRRSCNLRVATNAENIRNSTKYRRGVGASSQYKGVSRQKNGKFRAQIMCSGKKINIGSFTNEKAAAFAYDFNARKLFGEFARPNFPRQEAS